MGSRPRAPPLPRWGGPSWLFMTSGGSLASLSLSFPHLAHSVPSTGDLPPKEPPHSFIQEQAPTVPHPGRHLQPGSLGRAVLQGPGQEEGRNQCWRGRPCSPPRPDRPDCQEPLGTGAVGRAERGVNCVIEAQGFAKAAWKAGQPGSQVPGAQAAPPAPPQSETSVERGQTR